MKRRAKSKIRDFHEMKAELEAKGINVNSESLATRVKNPKRIAELEEAQDKKAKEQLGLSSDSDDSDIESDGDLKMEEQGRRGRSSKSVEKKPKSGLLGKRKREVQSDEDMISDDSNTVP